MSTTKSNAIDDGTPNITVNGGFGYGANIGYGARTALVDIDGDGDIDMVTLETDAGLVKTMLNNGTGTFTVAGTLQLPQNDTEYYASIGIAPMDVDNDGISDIIITEAISGRVLWSNAGTDGALQAFQDLNTGLEQPGSLTAADIDGDGLMDFVTPETVYTGGGYLSWYKNGGNGTFSLQDRLATPYGAPLSYAVGDLNGDGKADFVAGDLGDQIRAFVSNAEGGYTETPAWNQAVSGMALGDIDGDGKLDLVLSSTDYTQNIVWLQGQGDGTFGAAQVIANTSQDGSWPQGPDLVDLNGDGKLDIVEAASSGVNGASKFSWYENLGNGTFTEHEIGGLDYPSYGSPLTVVADLNGDGHADIATTNGVVLSRPSLTVAENVATALTGLSFADSDTTGPVTVTLGVESGALQAVSNTEVTATGSGASLTLVGTIEAINAFVAASNVTFQTALYDASNVDLHVAINDGTHTTTTDVTLDVTQGADPFILNGNAVDENSATGTVVGTLLPGTEGGDVLTFTLSDDANGKFEIVGNELRIKGPIDYESNGRLRVTVSIDDGGQTVSRNFYVNVGDVNEAPEHIALSSTRVGEDAEIGSTIATLSAVDPEGRAVTYALGDDANGMFEIVGAQLRLKGGLDYDTAPVYAISVIATDTTGHSSTKAFAIQVEQANPTTGEQPDMITLDASGSNGIDFEAFVRGGFISDVSGGGFPVFNNGATFSGDEMYLGYTGGDQKYIVADGELEYYFGTHTIHGTINTIEYGTKGSGTYDSNGHFSGGNTQLRITGLDLFNGLTPEADVEANGPVHNFTVAHMYGADGDKARLNTYADTLDTFAQHFIGSAGADTFVGAAYDDQIEGGNGADLLAGGGGNDTINGGGGTDTAIYTGNKANYTWIQNGNGTWTVTDERAGTTNDGVDILTSIEKLKFADDTVILSDVANSAPGSLALSKQTVAENVAINTVVGVLSATDPDGDTVSWTLSGGGGAFKLVTAGGITSVAVAKPLDFETLDTYSIKATASDGDLSASKTFAISVTDVVDEITGTSAGNVLRGSSGVDIIKGLGGNDTLYGYAGNDKLYGGDGNDMLLGGAGADLLSGGAGSDTASYVGATKGVTASLSDAGINTNDAKGDTYSSIENLTGTAFADRLVGNASANLIRAGIGNDIVEGGKGVDKLYGGAGKDTFVFKTGDTGKTHTSADTIYDFSGDHIDLTGWDANSTKGGTQDFDFIGKHAFSGHAGELRYVKEASDTWIEGDTNGDKKADFFIHLDDAVNLKAAHFDL